ncbi:MAG: pilus assembly protein N-terminal domain-containing protein [Myxococcaceae bacterium]
MKRLLAVLALVALPQSPALAGPDGGTKRATVVAVPIGGVKVVPAQGFERVVIDDPELAAVKPRNDRELVVTGLQDGTTTLWVYKKGGNPQTFQLKVGTGRAPAVSEVGDGGITAISGKAIELKVGAEMLVRISALEGLAVVDPEVAEARIISETLMVVRGVAAGSTHTLVYPRGGAMPTSYPVTVVGPPGGADAGL